MSIKENIAQVRRDIRTEGGADVTLVAVSKFKTIEDVRAAHEAGITDFGENRAQEFRDKYPQLPTCRWHFIGQLQLNKVKYVVGKAYLIQSLDRMALLEEIERRAGLMGVRQNVLIEVNFAREDAKGGVYEEDLPALVEAALACAHVELRGFMTVPPAGEAAAPWFDRMRGLYEHYRRMSPQINILSMGMSGDYKEAIAHGSTMVRVGSRIFGSRA